jgi:hypothetical protein
MAYKTGFMDLRMLDMTVTMIFLIEILIQEFSPLNHRHKKYDNYEYLQHEE